MRFFPALVLVILSLALATNAFAGDKYEVILKTGQTAMLEVTASEPESITVKFSKGEVSGETKVLASSMDPHSFYEIRRKTMEITAENHIKLAIFCVSNGLFNRGKYQVELAKVLDPTIVEKIKKMPDVMEKIADHLLEAARKAYKADDKQLAHDIGTRIVTSFPDTKAAAKVREVLSQLEQEIDEQVAAKAAARKKKIEDEKDEAVKKEAMAREKTLEPLHKMEERARKLNALGLQETGKSKAEKAFEAAAHEYRKLLSHIDKEMKDATEDAALTEALTAMAESARGKCVDSYINAGNVALRREDFNSAEKRAKEALAVDPNSAKAKAFVQKIDTARAMGDEIDGWRDRAGRGGPRRGGGGRR